MITPVHSDPLNTQNTRQNADAALNTADRAIDSTRQSAHNAIDAVDSKMQSLRSTVEPAVDMLASKAQHLAHQGVDAAMHAKDRVQESFVEYSDATARYVSRQPVKSVLMAAAFGAVLTLLLRPSRSSRRYDY
jgi:ElaB/YqjD/DUF883 family membrane-anchored ribosome-binding protein